MQRRKKPENTVQISTTILEKDYISLKKLSAKTHKPMSEITREFLLNGMKIEKNKDDIDFIRKQIREELKTVMDGYMSRIIKLLVKIGTLTVSMCYFTSKVIFVLVSHHRDKIKYDEMFEEAKKNDSDYLKIKDKYVDEIVTELRTHWVRS